VHITVYWIHSPFQVDKSIQSSFVTQKFDSVHFVSAEDLGDGLSRLGNGKLRTAPKAGVAER
jgi:hypothetical protein